MGKKELKLPAHTTNLRYLYIFRVDHILRELLEDMSVSHREGSVQT